MRKVQLFFAIFFSLSVSAQVSESFSDGDFTQDPAWSGHTTNFVVTSDKQLQSKAAATSVSWLTTPSLSINDATWQCTIKINYTTSSSNYACFYLVASNESLVDNTHGYYVQVGGTNDEVSLFYQNEKTKTKIIDGVDKRTDGSTVDITIKVLRDKHGNFSLYSKKASEAEFIKEGECTHVGQTMSSYVGLLYSNTTTTGSAYYFDDIEVTGKAEIDTIAPVCTQLKVTSENSIQLVFSEKIVIEKAQFVVDNGINNPKLVVLDASKQQLQLSFAASFAKGTLYNLRYTGIEDMVGNEMPTADNRFGLVENADSGDVVINEIMFDAAPGGQEYVELINRSEKLLDASKLVITTRKGDGSLNTGVVANEPYLFVPGAIVAWALNPDSVKDYHRTPVEAKFVQTDKWNTLNNESASLIISNLAKDTIYDEVNYSSKWHHVLIVETKGVALERVSPNRVSQDIYNWHSAASDVNFGTPGYQNSQFYTINDEKKSNFVWIEPESFSPNNDGINDICFIRYSTEYSGFVCNIRVFNPSGVLIASPAQNVLLSAEGYISWDGRTSKGTVVGIGIYVLYFEMFNVETGQKQFKKIPLVVSGR